MMSRKLQFFLLLLITFITFVVNNGSVEANIMEARNLTTAREMLQKGNWLEPTMNGELRLEKPPLPTWIAAGTIALFGDENLSLLRLPSAIAALLLIFFLFKLTSEITGDALLPFVTAGTAATSFYIFFMARDISWDIFCHSFMIGAIWLIHKGLKSEKSGRSDFVCAGVLMGLSFMSKGPVSFFALLLPYGIARSFTFGWTGWGHKKTGLTTMVLITMLISFWWPLLIWSLHPGISQMVAQQETSAWLERSTRPFYHYWSFPVQTGIWAILATISLVYPYAKPRISRYGNYTFMLLWVVSAVVLLSLFPEKKERYLLPVLLPLAMLTAFYFRYLTDALKTASPGQSDRVIFNVNVLLMALICLLIPVILIFHPLSGGKFSLVSQVTLSIVFWGLAIFFMVAFRKKNPFWLWMGMVGMVLWVCISLIPVASALAISNPAYRSYKELRYRSDLKGIPFFYNGEIPGKFIEVIWNSGHEVKSWDPAGRQQLPASPPIVFLSNQHPSVVLPASVLKNFTIEVIGHFDGNPGKRGGNVVLSNYVTVIR